MEHQNTGIKQHLFLKGFGDYFKSGDFSDLTLKTESGEVYRVHRIILIYSSEYFAKLLTGDFKEKNEDSIELKFKDPENLFPSVLQFMYNGYITITEKNSIPLLALADHYLIDSLRKKSSEFICNHITRANVINTLKHSLKFSVQEIISRCIAILAKNFCRFQDVTDWSFIPPNIFYRLLKEEYLTIKDEYSLYLLVKDYIGRNNLNEEQIAQLMGCIRFRWLSYDQLEAVKSDSLVPSNLFIEAIMVKLLHLEQPERCQELEQTDPRLKPRVAFGMQFEYSHDYDQQGVIYWISTNGGKESPQNPHLANRITVSASAMEKGQEYNLVSQTPTELWTKDVPASWFCIDLGENRTVLPTHYTLRHGGNYRSDCLRTWDFQGSINGRDWTLLRRHANDTSLKDPFQSYTWPIHTDTAYRRFRVLQTGHNSANHNFLLLSGIELYGDLYEFQHDEDA